MKKNTLKQFNEKSAFKRFIQEIKDRFRITKTMTQRCSLYGAKPYVPKVSKKQIAKAAPITIIAFLIPCPPITAAGVVYFAKVGLK